MKILTLTPHKPIVYPPGMISLVLLPIFCLVYLKQHKAFERQSWMTIAVWSPDWQNSLPKNLQRKFPPERKYLQIDLDGKNNIDDKTRLDFARLRIREMIRLNDMTNGVDFHFGTKAQYWTFIAALDICQTENVISYAPYKDDIYVVNTLPKKTDARTFICGTSYHYGNCLRQTPRDITLLQRITPYWLPAIVFLMTLFFAVRNLWVTNG